MLRNFYQCSINAQHTFGAIRCLSNTPFPEQLANMKKRRFEGETVKNSVDAATYEAYIKSTLDGKPMPREAANNLAKGMMNWAFNHGATKFAHWFHPVRGACGMTSSGLKKETFMDFQFGDKKLLKNFEPGGFDATRLFASETDGSSYPNGGLRSTPQASAFTGWDQLSPPFVRDSTLYIPACFVTWNGHALDEKTPLLRSNRAVNKQGLRLLRALGETGAGRVVTNVGCEQEYFIIPNDLCLARPDLISTGRTVLGASPARGQQTNQNYFGKYPPRISRMMQDVEAELWALGMSLIVQHNEVAPSQHEFSPVFALGNVAADQNIMAMEVMDEIAAQHDLRVLWHEKPFAGVNGSGKHCNWGLNTDIGDNLFVPGKTEASQTRFMAFLACLIRAVHVHGDTMRCTVSVAGNDYRLGAQEAPPAIMSVYTGQGLEEHIRKVLAGGALHGYHGTTRTIETGCDGVAPITGGAEDRNRTAPVPFCGNRFEFRAVGSSQNINTPMAIVNAAVAQSMRVLSEAIEGGKSPRDAVADMLKEHLPVVFNGNGYSEEWVKEAEGRGLVNHRTSVEALQDFDSAKNAELFEETGIFSPEELKARKEVLLEEHVNTIRIEASVMVRMLETGIIPAAYKDLKNIPESSQKKRQIYAQLEESTEALKKVLDNHSFASMTDEADYMNTVVKKQMLETREVADSAELVMDRDLYPFPTYEKMLYHHHFDK